MNHFVSARPVLLKHINPGFRWPGAVQVSPLALSSNQAQKKILHHVDSGTRYSIHQRRARGGEKPNRNLGEPKCERGFPCRQSGPTPKALLRYNQSSSTQLCRRKAAAELKTRVAALQAVLVRASGPSCNSACIGTAWQISSSKHEFDNSAVEH